MSLWAGGQPMSRLILRLNTIYVTSLTNSGGGNGTVTVINGNSLATQTVQTGYDTYSVAINPVTNTIYATNLCGNSVTCQNGGSVTVINGATLGTQSARTAYLPYWLALNTVTNKIYVANDCTDAACSQSPSVTVIDGTSLQTTSIPVCSAGATAADIEVNAAANQIYFPCDMPGGNVTIINGVTNGTSNCLSATIPWPRPSTPPLIPRLSPTPATTPSPSSPPARSRRCSSLR